MNEPLKCPHCKDVLFQGEDHVCEDSKGIRTTITKYAIAGRIRRSAAGICPGCGGTGKERIHHLVADPKFGIGARTDHVEENECPECS
jgi:hypothetical protein